MYGCVLITCSGGPHESTDDDTDDELPLRSRGRTFSISKVHSNAPLSSRAGRHSPSSTDSTRTVRHNSKTSYPHSRSPNGRPHLPYRTLSPAMSKLSSQQRHSFFGNPILGAQIHLQHQLPFTSWTWHFLMDTRGAGECLLLLLSNTYGAMRLVQAQHAPNYDQWILLGITYPLSTNVMLTRPFQNCSS